MQIILNFKIEDTLVKENGGENAGHMQHAVPDKKSVLFLVLLLLMGSWYFKVFFLQKCMCKGNTLTFFKDLYF